VCGVQAESVRDMQRAAITWHVTPICCSHLVLSESMAFLVASAELSVTSETAADIFASWLFAAHSVSGILDRMSTWARLAWRRRDVMDTEFFCGSPGLSESSVPPIIPSTCSSGEIPGVVPSLWIWIFAKRCFCKLETPELPLSCRTNVAGFSASSRFSSADVLSGHPSTRRLSMIRCVPISGDLKR